MTPYLLAAAVGVLAFGGGYLKGTRQHVAEEAQATWVHELTATPSRPRRSAPLRPTMRRSPALARSRRPARPDLLSTPIFARMGPLPVELEPVSV